MDRKKQEVNQLKLVVISGGAVVLLCLVLIVMCKNKTIQIRSDSAGVEFVTEDNNVSEVTVCGRLPYGLVVPSLEESSVTDTNGKVIEQIRTYTLEAEISLHLQGKMKINIETSNDVIQTYILKFANGEITIKNGKVVE